MECVFCKIINGEIPVKKIWENEYVLAFDDNKPVHPVHVLLIPKKHIANIQQDNRNDKDYLAELLLAVPEVAEIKNVDKTGYRLIINYGKDSGQTVDHLHIHLVGGEELPFATA